jgi:hypothetical protein
VKHFASTIVGERPDGTLVAGVTPPADGRPRVGLYRLWIEGESTRPVVLPKRPVRKDEFWGWLDRLKGEGFQVELTRLS